MPLSKKIGLHVGLFFSLLFPTLAFATDFTPPDTDLSMIYLTSIFGAVGGVLEGSGSQILGALFRIFNSGMMFLGGVIMVYILFVSTLNTAQEGEVMGKKWSSIWIPMRSVMGMAMLIPKTSGYSLIQVLVMWVVVQGVGLADKVWNAALVYLYNGGVIVQVASSADLSSGTNQAAANALSNLMTSQVCVYALQKAVESVRNDKISHNVQPYPDVVPNMTGSFYPSSVQTNFVAIPTVPSNSYYSDLNQICGNIYWDKTSGSAYTDSSLSDARGMGIEQMILDTGSSAQQIVDNDQLPNGSPAKKTTIGNCPNVNMCRQDQWTTNSVLGGRVLKDAYDHYYSIVQPSLQKANVDATNSYNLLNTYEKGEGWIMAGKYYQTITTANNKITQSSTDKAPNVTPPSTSLSEFCAQKSLGKYLGDNATNVCQQYFSVLYTKDFQNFLTSAVSYKTAAWNTTGTTDLSSIKSAFLNRNLSTGNSYSNSVSSYFNSVGDVYDTFQTVQNAQNSGTNPLVLAPYLGSVLINCAFTVWIGILGSLALWGAGLGALIWTTVSSAIMVVAECAMPMVMLIVGSMVVTGCVLMYYIPLIPFIIYTFSAIGWFMGVIESMVAAPIVALGIAHPEGHEAFGKADQATLLLANLFLRPCMMVIGLIAGVSLSYVAVWFLNAGFSQFDQAAAGITSGWGLLMYPVARCVVYTMMLINVLQKAFTLIHHVPDKVMRWIGGGQESLGAESAQQALSDVKGATTSMGEKVSSGMTSAQQAAQKASFEAAKSGGSDGGGTGDLSKGNDASGASMAAGVPPIPP